MNVWNFVGRIAADAELKHVGDSTVTEFRCAVDSGWGDRKATTWVRCNMWGKRGEAVTPYLLKGGQVAVSGELTNREYDKNDGTKGYSLEVRVNELTLVGGKKETTPAQKPPPAKPAQQAAAEPDGFTDDDIPFSGEAA